MTNALLLNIARRAQEIANQDKNQDVSSAYRMFEDYCSPYSAKVRAFLRYKEIPYRRMRTTMDIYLQKIPELVGMSIIPVILTPDDQVMQDSTPIMQWFETEYPHISTVPTDPALAFIMWLVEDFADEYLCRFSMHFRWNYEPNAETLSYRLARNFSYGTPLQPKEVAPLLRQRQSGICNYLGLTSEAGKQDIEQQLIELLSILEDHFQHYQFLLGNRPSMADFALYGQLWAHLFNDPHSAQLMEKYGANTCHWLESITDLGDTRGQVGQKIFGDWIDLNEETPVTLKSLLNYISQTYIPFSSQTALAAANKQKTSTMLIRGIETTFSTSQYRAWAFEQVQLRYQALDKASKDLLEPILKETSILSGLFQHGILHSTLLDGFTPPFVKDGIADNRIKYFKTKH